MVAETQSRKEVAIFESAGGARIFQIPMEEFPGFWGYAYLVMLRDASQGEIRALIDTGSGFGRSNEHLEAGLRAVGKITGADVSIANLTHVLITHGHIDHFGGLVYVRQRTQARIGVHELDLRNLINYEERIVVVARRLEDFLIDAGVREERRTGLLALYKINKGLYQSVHVDYTYESVGMEVGPFRMLHVPGHCAGHVVIRLHDVLFSGDHVLEGITPHQSPEHMTLSTGLEHYLRSVDKLRKWAPDVRLTLGGHKEPIYDLVSRLDAIKELHAERLEQVLSFLKEAHTVQEVSMHLFRKVQGYNVLLALEEAGAHVEYLYQRGLLGIQNLDELEKTTGRIPILYYRL